MNVRVIAVMLGVIGFCYGCEKQTGETDVKQAALVQPSNATVLNFHVTGMHCDGCAQGIKSKLAKIDGVIEVDASFENSSATVMTSNPAIASKIVETIEEMQYHSELIEG